MVKVTVKILELPVLGETEATGIVKPFESVTVNSDGTTVVASTTPLNVTVKPESDV